MSSRMRTARRRKLFDVPRTTWSKYPALSTGTMRSTDTGWRSR